MDRVSLILTILGGVNWLLVGLFQFDHQPHRLCRNRHRGAVVHLAAVYREKGD